MKDELDPPHIIHDHNMGQEPSQAINEVENDMCNYQEAFPKFYIYIYMKNIIPLVVI
jgi:hypothetical protein